MNFKIAFTALAALAAGVAIAACGSQAAGVEPAPSGGLTSATTAATTPATTTTATATVTTPSSGPLSKEPVITVPSGPAPTKLVEHDLIVGTGATATDGSEVSVNYVGALYSNGKTFDASWTDEPGKAFGPFELGAGAVIPGWDQGLIGMKVGGRRELIIPPSLGYGKAGSPPKIPGNATLIFIVDLLAVSK
jgi:FKBP-type peptidyl-prolyl cis-trans isomerase